MCLKIRNGQTWINQLTWENPRSGAANLVHKTNPACYFRAIRKSGGNQIKSKAVFCNTWKLCEIQLSVSINKLLLNKALSFISALPVMAFIPPQQLRSGHRDLCVLSLLCIAVRHSTNCNGGYNCQHFKWHT
jgi:hypothetical protein